MALFCKGLRWVFAIIVTLVVATTGIALLVINHGSTPYQLYAVRTASMSPTIPSRSEVLVRKGEYHVGQVITFKYAGEIVTHRLIKLEDGFATTKGDDNPTPDPIPLPEQNIIGGVVAAPQQLGFILMFITNTYGGKLDLVLLVALAWWVALFPDKETPKTESELAKSADESITL